MEPKRRRPFSSDRMHKYFKPHHHHHHKRLEAMNVEGASKYYSKESRSVSSSSLSPRSLEVGGLQFTFTPYDQGPNDAEEDLCAIDEDSSTLHVTSYSSCSSVSNSTSSRRRAFSASGVSVYVDRSESERSKETEESQNETKVSRDFSVPLNRKVTRSPEDIKKLVEAHPVWNQAAEPRKVFRIAFRLSEARKVPVKYGCYFTIKLNSPTGGMFQFSLASDN